MSSTGVYDQFTVLVVCLYLPGYLNAIAGGKTVIFFSTDDQSRTLYIFKLEKKYALLGELGPIGYIIRYAWSTYLVNTARCNGSVVVVMQRSSGLANNRPLQSILLTCS